MQVFDGGALKCNQRKRSGHAVTKKGEVSQSRGPDRPEGKPSEPGPTKKSQQKYKTESA